MKPVDGDINGARNILIRALRDGSATSWDTGGCLVQNLWVFIGICSENPSEY